MCLCPYPKTIWTQRIVSDLYYSVLKLNSFLFLLANGGSGKSKLVAMEKNTEASKICILELYVRNELAWCPKLPKIPCFAFPILVLHCPSSWHPLYPSHAELMQVPRPLLVPNGKCPPFSTFFSHTFLFFLLLRYSWECSGKAGHGQVCAQG